MKRCVAAFLLALVLLQSGGLWLCYEIYLISHRKAQREAVFAQTDLVVFSFSNEEFQARVTDGTELELDGVWYDIESMVSIDGRIEVHAAIDSQENELMRVFSSLFECEEDPEARDLVDFSLIDFIMEQAPEISFLPCSQAILKQALTEIHFSSVCCCLLSPPPEVLEVV
jgi:hypothetical protein